MSVEVERICALLRDALTARNPSDLPEDMQGDQAVSALYAELLELRRMIMAIAGGDLSVSSGLKGYTSGALKTLQANLKHMTWQTQMIASGDFSQRLDFLGDFSKAFNTMARQLEDSLRTIREHEQELQVINEGLEDEICRREETQAALARSEAHYRNLTETMKDVVWVLDTETMCFVYISPSIRGLCGYEAEELVGREFDILLSPGDAQHARMRIHENRDRFRQGEIRPQDYHTVEVEFTCKDGSKVWAEYVSRYVFNDKTGSVELHGVTRDVSERRALRLELELQATTDSLTGIANRRHYLDILNKEMARCRRHHCRLSLLMLDIDHFKGVNDTYGHAVGDVALQRVSEICMTHLRSFDLVGRLGGEEFAMMLVGADLELACEIADRLRHQIEVTTIALGDGREFRLTVSIGVSEFREATDTEVDFLARADIALYRAKENGRNRLECFLDEDSL